jgi:hypothetical protein
VFYLGLARDPAYVEEFIEGFLESMARRIRMRSTSSGTFGRRRGRHLDK